LRDLRAGFAAGLGAGIVAAAAAGRSGGDEDQSGDGVGHGVAHGERSAFLGVYEPKNVSARSARLEKTSQSAAISR